jgi:hypothetical protein
MVPPADATYLTRRSVETSLNRTGTSAPDCSARFLCQISCTDPEVERRMPVAGRKRPQSLHIVKGAILGWDWDWEPWTAPRTVHVPEDPILERDVYYLLRTSTL